MSKLQSILADLYHEYFWSRSDYKKIRFQSPEDKQRMEEQKCDFVEIEHKEYSYGNDRRERTYQSKRDRIEREIGSIPAYPKKLDEFVYQCMHKASMMNWMN